MSSNPLKKILLCICGSIAAYKSLELIRILQEQGIEVEVAMSEAAQKFVTPLSLETISKNKVILSSFQATKTGKIDHIESAQNVDLILIAPATANILSKFVCGIGDDLISTILLAADAPIIFSPAMNDKMWEKEIVQTNRKKAEKLGAIVLETEKGVLACGSYGMGKMKEPESIARFITSHWVKNSTNNYKGFQGKKVLLTLGATREYLDPFRFITNDSSGKMGMEIAHILKNNQVEVFLICGVVKVDIPSTFGSVFVSGTKQMADEVISRAPDYDIVIMCAAISDYKVKAPKTQKIKTKEMNLSLHKTVDILYQLGKTKKEGQILVGFSAETENMESYATEKLKRKNLDIIFANKINTPTAGFGAENSTFQIISRENKGKIATRSKMEAASELITSIHQTCLAKIKT
jgi:phosphopantothenoylcysteine decarboxylase/phosphopantothenate--cysteine ligase